MAKHKMAPIQDHDIKLANKIKREIRKTNNNEFTNFIMNLDNTNYSLWKSTKKLKRPKFPLYKNRTENGPRQKTKPKPFRRVYPNIPPNNNNNERLKYKAIRKEEIFTIIKKLKINKTPGYDLITKNAKKNPGQSGKIPNNPNKCDIQGRQLPPDLEVCRNHTSTKTRQKSQIPIIL